jgi:DNA polymerase/3'-5' exonuclease PolX
MLADPTTRDDKTKGTITILISLKNKSPIGLIALADGPKMKPKMIPRAKPMRILK